MTLLAAQLLSQVLKDVLPLLEDEDGVEVGGLVDVEGYGSTSSIQEEVVPHSYKVLSGQHSPGCCWCCRSLLH